MATISGSGPSWTEGRLRERLASLLAGYARRYRRLRLTHGVSLWAILFLAPLPVACLLDRFFLLPDALRRGFWGIYVLAILGAAYAWVVRRYVHRPRPLDVAFAIGDQKSDIKQGLAAAVQFPEGVPPRDAGVSSELISAVRQTAEDQARAIDEKALLPGRLARRRLAAALGLLGLQLALLAVPRLGYGRLLLRFFNPFANWGRVSGVEVQVTPGSVEVARGETVVVEAQVSDTLLPRLWLHSGDAGAAPSSFAMQRVQPGLFRFRMPNLRRDATYYLAEGLIQTPRFAIKVRSRPRLKHFVLRYEYPKHSGRQPSEELRNDGNFSAYRGARVTVNAEWDSELSRALCRRGAKEQPPVETAMRVDGRRTTVTFDMDGSFDYELIAYERERGLENSERVSYTATVVRDEPPAVHMLAPGPEVKRGCLDREEILFRATDEFRVEAVRMEVRMGEGAATHRGLLAEGLGTALVQGRGVLSLSELGAEPGDRISVTVQARDSLGQWGSSRAAVIEIPVASGDRDARESAESVHMVYRNFEEMQYELGLLRDIFLHMQTTWSVGLFHKAALKWTAEMEKTYQTLRRGLEDLEEKAQRAAGVSVRAYEDAASDSVREELTLVRQIAVEFSRTVKHLDIDSLLYDLKEDFKGAGPDRIRDVLRVWDRWTPIFQAAVDFLGAYEAHHWSYEYRARSVQLLTAQQGVWIGLHRERPDLGRLRARQKMILRETKEFIEDRKYWPSGDRGFWARLLPELFGAQEDIEKRLEAGEAMPMDRIAEFQAFLMQASEGFQAYRSSGFRRGQSNTRQELTEMWAARQSVPLALGDMVKAVEKVARALKEDPIDKRDEGERLPGPIGDLRLVFEDVSRLEADLWGRARNNPDTDARRRHDLCLMAEALGQLQRNRAEGISALCKQIVATFSSDSESALPHVKAVREPLAALHKDLEWLRDQAKDLERAHVLDALAESLAGLMQKQSDLSETAEVLGVECLRFRHKVSSLALAWRQDEGTKEFLETASKSVGPLSGNLEVWNALRARAAGGTPQAAAARKALMSFIERRETSLERLIDHMTTLAQRSRALSEAYRKADEPQTGAPLPARLHGLLLSQQKVQQRLAALESLWQAESAWELSQKSAGDAKELTPAALHSLSLRHLATLALRGMDEEHVRTAVALLTRAEVLADPPVKARLLDMVAQENTAAAARLREASGPLADPAGKGAPWVTRFADERGLASELADARKEIEAVLRFAAQVGQASRQTSEPKEAKGGATQPAESPADKARVLLAKAQGAAAEHIEQLEQVTHALSMTASEQEELCTRLEHVEGSRQAVQDSYEAMVKTLPPRLNDLHAKFRAADEPAQRMNYTLGWAIRDTLRRLEKSHKYLDKLLKEPAAENGKAFIDLLAVRYRGWDLGELPVILDAAVKRQEEVARARADVKAIHGRLAPALAALKDLTGRYAAEHKARDAAYDRMAQALKRAYDMTGPGIGEPWLKPYVAPSDNTRWLWEIDRDLASAYQTGDPAQLKGLITDAAIDAGVADPDALRGRLLMMLWRARLLGRVNRWAPIGVALTEKDGRHFRVQWTGRDSKGENTEVRGPAPRFLKEAVVAGRDRWWGMDQWIAYLEGCATRARPDDAARLGRLLEDLRKARALVLSAAGDSEELLADFAQARHRWAAEVLEIRRLLAGHVKELVERAEAHDFKPPSFDPDKRPTRAELEPKPTLASAAYFGLLLANELDCLRAQDLLEGTSGKKAVSDTPPGKDLFARAAGWTGTFEQVLSDTARFLELPRDASARTGLQEKESEMAQSLHSAIRRRYYQLNDQEFLAHVNSMWERLKEEFPKIKADYLRAWPKEQAFKKDKYAWGRFREEYAGRVSVWLTEVSRVFLLLRDRAAAAGRLWQPPAQDLFSPEGRRALKVPAQSADLHDAVTAFGALWAEMRGLRDYEMLDGTWDPRERVVGGGRFTMREKMPPLDVFDQALALIPAVDLHVKALRHTLSATGAGGGQGHQLLRDDIDRLRAAARALTEIQIYEPTRRAALVAADSGAAAIRREFVTTQQRAQARLVDARGRLSLVDSLLGGSAREDPWANALKEIIKAFAKANADRFFDLRANDVDWRRSVAREDVPRLVKSVRSRLPFLRTQAKALRAAIEAWRQSPAANVAHQGTDAGAHRLIRAAAVKILADLPGPDAATTQARRSVRLAHAAQCLSQAGEQALEAIGGGWLQRHSRKAQQTIAAMVRQALCDDTLATASNPGPLAGDGGPSTADEQPNETDLRGSDYGRLSPQQLRRLDQAGKEPCPPESEALWRRYTASLKNPPAPKRAERIVAVWTDHLGFTVKNRPEFHDGAEDLRGISSRIGYSSGGLLKRSCGVRVVGVRPGSPAWFAGLFGTSWISHVNGKPVYDIEDYMAAVRKGDPKEGVLVRGVRHRQAFECIVQETGSVFRKE